MSETHRDPGGLKRKGSVRRAREMMEAGIPAGQNFDQYEDPYLHRTTKNSKNQEYSRRPDIPAAFKAPSNGSKGAVISTPAPMAQWPLQDDGDAPRREQKPLPNIAPPPRGPPPQRPPRPGNVPSLLDASKVRDYTPSIPNHQYEQDPSYPFPVNSPRTSTPEGNSFHSTNDSDWMESGRPMNTLPDFPRSTPRPQPQNQIHAPQIAMVGPPGRRNVGLGPPPAGRRGASSYYSTGSMVPPIPEEVPEQTPRYGGSFASSKAIPSSWGSGPPESAIIRDYENPVEDSLRDHRYSLHDDETTLVRQASLGKRGKPSLRTINKSVNEQSESRSIGESLNSKNSPESGVFGTVPPAIPTILRNSEHSPDKKGGLGRRNSDSSDSTLGDLEKPPIPMSKYESSSQGTTLKDVENGTFEDTSAPKLRPPRLNIDAVREAEARGSLTSLPDLIRRATKLRTNLDRGKTASRLGMLDLINGSGELRKSARNSGSISDILGSFPRPGAATPTGIPNRANPDVNFAHTEEQPPVATRRCCGMRRSVFIFLCILVLLLIIAAVLVPVFLIVVPRQHEVSQAEVSAAAKDSCQSTHPCMNGGISVGTAESCSCVCFGGFSGSKCDVAGDNSCVTTGIMDGSSDFQNVTLGSALPRLFEYSGANFSIPLNASKIVAVLNADDTSCTSTNALVTFNGASRKRSNSLVSEIHEILGQGITSHHRRSHLHRLVQRSADNAADNQDNKAENSSPTRTVTGATLPTDTSSPSIKPTASSPVTIRALDFSRVAVLYLLELSGSTGTAIDVHDSIQDFLKDPRALSKGTMDHSSGSGSAAVDFTLDYDKFTISLGDGTTVGGS